MMNLILVGLITLSTFVSHVQSNLPIDNVVHIKDVSNYDISPISDLLTYKFTSGSNGFMGSRGNRHAIANAIVSKMGYISIPSQPRIDDQPTPWIDSPNFSIVADDATRFIIRMRHFNSAKEAKIRFYFNNINCEQPSICEIPTPLQYWEVYFPVVSDGSFHTYEIPLLPPSVDDLKYSSRSRVSDPSSMRWQFNNDELLLRTNGECLHFSPTDGTETSFVSDVDPSFPFIISEDTSVRVKFSQFRLYPSIVAIDNSFLGRSSLTSEFIDSAADIESISIYHSPTLLSVSSNLDPFSASSELVERQINASEYDEYAGSLWFDSLRQLVNNNDKYASALPYSVFDIYANTPSCSDLDVPATPELAEQYDDDFPKYKNTLPFGKTRLVSTASVTKKAIMRRNFGVMLNARRSGGSRIFIRGRHFTTDHVFKSLVDATNRALSASSGTFPHVGGEFPLITVDGKECRNVLAHNHPAPAGSPFPMDIKYIQVFSCILPPSPSNHRVTSSRSLESLRENPISHSTFHSWNKLASQASYPLSIVSVTSRRTLLRTKRPLLAYSTAPVPYLWLSSSESPIAAGKTLEQALQNAALNNITIPLSSYSAISPSFWLQPPAVVAVTPGTVQAALILPPASPFDSRLRARVGEFAHWRASATLTPHASSVARAQRLGLRALWGAFVSQLQPQVHSLGSPSLTPLSSFSVSEANFLPNSSLHSSSDWVDFRAIWVPPRNVLSGLSGVSELVFPREEFTSFRQRSVLLGESSSPFLVERLLLPEIVPRGSTITLRMAAATELAPRLDHSTTLQKNKNKKGGLSPFSQVSVAAHLPLHDVFHASFGANSLLPFSAALWAPKAGPASPPAILPLRPRTDPARDLASAHLLARALARFQALSGAQLHPNASLVAPLLRPSGLGAFLDFHDAEALEVSDEGDILTALPLILQGSSVAGEPQAQEADSFPASAFLVGGPADSLDAREDAAVWLARAGLILQLQAGGARALHLADAPESPALGPASLTGDSPLDARLWSLLAAPEPLHALLMRPGLAFGPADNGNGTLQGLSAALFRELEGGTLLSSRALAEEGADGAVAGFFRRGRRSVALHRAVRLGGEAAIPGAAGRVGGPGRGQEGSCCDGFGGASLLPLLSLLQFERTDPTQTMSFPDSADSPGAAQHFEGHFRFPSRASEGSHRNAPAALKGAGEGPLCLADLVVRRQVNSLFSSSNATEYPAAYWGFVDSSLLAERELHGEIQSLPLEDENSFQEWLQFAEKFRFYRRPSELSVADAFRWRPANHDFAPFDSLSDTAFALEDDQGHSDEDSLLQLNAPHLFSGSLALGLHVWLREDALGSHSRRQLWPALSAAGPAAVRLLQFSSADLALVSNSQFRRLSRARERARQATAAALLANASSHADTLISFSPTPSGNAQFDLLVQRLLKSFQDPRVSPLEATEPFPEAASYFSNGNDVLDTEDVMEGEDSCAIPPFWHPDHALFSPSGKRIVPLLRDPLESCSVVALPETAFRKFSTRAVHVVHALLRGCTPADLLARLARTSPSHFSTILSALPWSPLNVSIVDSVDFESFLSDLSVYLNGTGVSLGDLQPWSVGFASPGVDFDEFGGVSETLTALTQSSVDFSSERTRQSIVDLWFGLERDWRVLHAGLPSEPLAAALMPLFLRFHSRFTLDDPAAELLFVEQWGLPALLQLLENTESTRAASMRGNGVKLLFPSLLRALGGPIPSAPCGPFLRLIEAYPKKSGSAEVVVSGFLESITPFNRLRMLGPASHALASLASTIVFRESDSNGICERRVSSSHSANDADIENGDSRCVVRGSGGITLQLYRNFKALPRNREGSTTHRIVPSLVMKVLGGSAATSSFDNNVFYSGDSAFFRLSLKVESIVVPLAEFRIPSDLKMDDSSPHSVDWKYIAVGSAAEAFELQQKHDDQSSISKYSSSFVSFSSFDFESNSFNNYNWNGLNASESVSNLEKALHQRIHACATTDSSWGLIILKIDSIEVGFYALPLPCILSPINEVKISPRYHGGPPNALNLRDWIFMDSNSIDENYKRGMQLPFESEFLNALESEDSVTLSVSAENTESSWRAVDVLALKVDITYEERVINFT